MLLQLLHSLPDTLDTSTLIYTTVFLLIPPVLIVILIQNGDISTTHQKLKHLRRIGLSTSNMTDQYDPKYNISEDSPNTSKPRIKALYIHPVKSCGYIEVNQALLTKTGFMYDRYFSFATEENSDSGPKWRFISQRTKPLMTQIKTELWLPHERSDALDPLVQAGGCILLTFPDVDIHHSWMRRLEMLYHTGDFFATPHISFIVPLQPTPTQIDEFGLTLKQFTIHKRTTTGLDMGIIPSVAAALPKLKTFLKIPHTQRLTLFKTTPDTPTRTEGSLAPLEYIGSPSVHGYTDQQPININSLSSVQAVSALLPDENKPLNALRFRANIWITGAPAYAEESWTRCRILPKPSISTDKQRATLAVVCRTSRCTMPNVNPDTGKVDTDIPSSGKKRGKPQPSTTLVKHRMVESGNQAALGYIGVHCVPEDSGLGVYVHVGDEIEVLG
ncbi:hypothetical protein ASPWEDRAFT_39550 [Aspergillus wentii DTO 134E9]|uniref:MOSC domain-containing protein n=1 Tax=Aspergillus wentii DTO 134E9 TaxID=1073089 RepID=A0A1L9RS91_ASPWE|nr:uncharacterized protein ASPWEDRAFT_39550 [Aspergillus wentii DTO 134E9]KAI9930649.1 hypothetical protein MW887_011404 [Aspergillus wentii]OJJ37811.1 hypothetical protein ASPWEDRAFT_39550 [Aspergillus wentii DTO 134E9]